MKYIRFINKLILITVLSAALSFVVSSLWEVLTLMATLRQINLHNVDATAYQPYLYLMFYCFFAIIEIYFLLKLKH